MAEHGGYRKPSSPAATSGPGKLSRRTDGTPTMDLTDAAYGENKDFREIQAGAPMGSGGSGSAPQGAGLDLSSFTGLGEPSTMPDSPVTDGAEYGAGAGQEALNLSNFDPDREDAQYLAKYLPTLIRIAESDDTPPGTKRYIRSIISRS